MPLIEIVIGGKSYPSVEVPDACTVETWKQLLKQGSLGEKLAGVTRLTCYDNPLSARALAETALMTSPAKVFIDGPASVTGQIASSLQKKAKIQSEPATSGIEDVEPMASLRLLRSPTSRFARHRDNVIASRSQDAALACDAEASAVNDFWFNQLTPDDWFRQSQELDDRIKQEFGSLHSRAAAGELAGWMDRPETCIALVVVLDQFSRILYRGTPGAYACDAQARAAANAALARGDDRTHWKAGVRRSALYLPFMHSALAADGYSARGAAGVDVAGSYRAAKAAASLGAVGLPRLTSATATVAKRFGSTISAKSLMHDGANDDGANSDSDDQMDSVFGRQGSPPAKSGERQTPRTPRGASGGDSLRTTSTSLPEELFGTYSKAALDVPQIPVLTLNHEHAKRFRSMRLDASTQQVYNRDQNARAKAQQRYNCLVCAIPHEFSLSRGVHGAEHQHHSF